MALDKELLSPDDRRGPADDDKFARSAVPAEQLRLDKHGIRPDVPNRGGVPAGPIDAGRARRLRNGNGNGNGHGGHGHGTCTYNVTRQSSTGPLLTTPHVVLMWWSTYFWDSHLTERHYYRDALQAVANDPAFWSRLGEYGITGGSFSGQIDLTRFGGGNQLSEQAIRDAITYRFNVSQITPDESAIYVVMLPNGVTSDYDTANGFIGHHQTYSYNGRNIWYAVAEYSTDTRQTMSVITHEVYEAATDPDGSTGYWDPAHGGETEVGDLCNLQTMIMDGYPVQLVWSQNSCGCR
jgi:hypothetical protein